MTRDEIKGALCVLFYLGLSLGLSASGYSSGLVPFKWGIVVAVTTTVQFPILVFSAGILISFGRRAKGRAILALIVSTVIGTLVATKVSSLAASDGTSTDWSIGIGFNVASIIILSAVSTVILKSVGWRPLNGQTQ